MYHWVLTSVCWLGRRNVLTTEIAKKDNDVAESAEMLADALAYNILLRNREAAGQTVDPELVEIAKSMAMNALNYYWALIGVKVEL